MGRDHGHPYILSTTVLSDKPLYTIYVHVHVCTFTFTCIYMYIHVRIMVVLEAHVYKSFFACINVTGAFAQVPKRYVYVITPFGVVLPVYPPEGGGRINRNTTTKGVIKYLLPGETALI